VRGFTPDEVTSPDFREPIYTIPDLERKKRQGAHPTKSLNDCKRGHFGVLRDIGVDTLPPSVYQNLATVVSVNVFLKYR